VLGALRHAQNNSVYIPMDYKHSIHISPRVVTGEKNSPTVAHACCKRRLKRVFGAWGYNWATQSLGGYKYGDLVLQVGGWSTGLATLSL
jgi:hypothetical protein